MDGLPLVVVRDLPAHLAHPFLDLLGGDSGTQGVWFRDRIHGCFGAPLDALSVRTSSASFGFQGKGPNEESLPGVSHVVICRTREPAQPHDIFATHQYGPG